MQNEVEKVKQVKEDRGLEFGEFLDKVHARVVDRAREKRILGILRLGNVWRVRNVEAAITHGSAPDDVQLTFRRGTDGTRTRHYKAGSVDSTADEIIDNFVQLTR